jgi:hypothetical protein
VNKRKRDREMPQYDNQEIGNDFNFVKKDGIIVGCMGWNTFTKEQLPYLHHGLQKFFVYDVQDEYEIRGVTPKDALEALRRYSSALADDVVSGELKMYRLHLVPIRQLSRKG